MFLTEYEFHKPNPGEVEANPSVTDEIRCWIKLSFDLLRSIEFNFQKLKTHVNQSSDFQRDWTCWIFVAVLSQK